MILAIRDVGWNRQQVVVQDYVAIPPLRRHVPEAIGLGDFISAAIYQMIENAQLIRQVSRPLVNMPAIDNDNVSASVGCKCVPASVTCPPNVKADSGFC